MIELASTIGDSTPNVINSISKEIKIQDIMDLMADSSNLLAIRALIKPCLYAITPGVDLGDQTIDNVMEDFSS